MSHPYGNGMVVSPQPEASEAGLEILRAGGNAVDAAIAMAFVQGVVDPMMCGISGFGSMAVYDPNTGKHEYIDFHSPAPGAATSTSSRLSTSDPPVSWIHTALTIDNLMLCLRFSAWHKSSPRDGGPASGQSGAIIGAARAIR